MDTQEDRNANTATDTYYDIGASVRSTTPGSPPMQFFDRSDRRFLYGIELRHFGLMPHRYAQDEIDLRADETDALETETNDRIALALINGKKNTGDKRYMDEADELMGET
ncbi:hypothetical protein BX666DRAFT_1964298 [Dichotomocladium elegans]|nr:hypothetical protein BX666DRAFT_1964298 [Dichotomocladium elegans]